MIQSSNLLTEVRPGALKGIGEKTEKLFGKVGIGNLDQLVHYYPRAYDAYTECVDISALRPNEKQAVQVRIKRPPVVKTGGRVPVTILEVSGAAALGQSVRLQIIWFNMPYLRSVLKAGGSFVFRGMVRAKTGGVLTMEQPEQFTAEAYEKIRGTIQPVYALTAGLRNKVIASAVAQVFSKYTFLEYLPETLLCRHGLYKREKALGRIHFPSDAQELSAARRRIVFDEFLFYFLRLGQLGADTENRVSCYPVRETPLSDRILAGLSFSLTAAQSRVWDEIRADLASGRCMNRLLQGDVGSGKTIVAFLSIAAMIDKGWQSTLMVPTEVLAEQHYAAFQKLIAANGLPEEAVVLLTGSMGAKEKRLALERIRTGEVLVVIGTHAVIQDRVEFANLALAVTDEQHRFGVRQRGLLQEKGAGPHVLVMSATPIPRTLALILYGDLELSVIDELPADRLRIKNCVVDPSYRKTAYAFMQKEIRSGHQVYIICPMIAPNEDLGCENVLEYTQKLKKCFPQGVRVEMLHGQMTAAQKLQVMRDFSENRIQILVSTTVVEVGVDVPNATVMMIENAERFGLAQLHQLRGRIGRGKDQSYCIFMQGDDREETNKRLDVLNHENDGFAIAREDLKLRGQGDLFGLRQSGEACFTLADPFADAAVMQEAKEAAKEILQKDPKLSTEIYRPLADMLEQMSNQMENIL